MTPTFADRAIAEIDGLHRVLQAWFRAEGERDPALVLNHFDPRYTMVTPTGVLLPYATFAAAVPGLWGTRPTLVMTITGETIRHIEGGAALITYHERQDLAGTTTNRISTALLLDVPGRATPVWRHLQETLLP